jgi:hypothetical protein
MKRSNFLPVAFYWNLNIIINKCSIFEYGMISWKLVDTSISTSKAIIPSDPLFSNATRFRQIVDALQYLSFARPDICFVVNRVCQFMHAPTDSHWAIVKRILRYLKGTTTHGLYITHSSFFPLHDFTNADSAGSIDDKKI